MKELSDDEIRSRFEALRRADRQSPPQFETLLAPAVQQPERTAPARVRWQPSVLLSLAAAAAILLTVDAARRASQLRELAAPPLAAPPLADWTSPTASLLRTSGADLLASPTLIPSVLDGLTLTMDQRKGHQP